MKAIWSKPVAAAMLIAAMTMLSTAGLAQDKAPDATFRYSGATAAAGVGVSWGHGTLTFQGKDYPFRIRGIDVADVGITKITATGGMFTTCSAPATLRGHTAPHRRVPRSRLEVSERVMKNDQGVIVRMASTTKGAQLKAAVEGVTIELEGPSESQAVAAGNSAGSVV